VSTDELTLDGWMHAYSGKVRDLYVVSGQELDTAERVLMVASDRVSAFDFLLEPGIPGKGELLTTLSLWWFNQLDGISNHLVASDDAGIEIPDAVAGRAMLARTLDMFPIECVVRGYLAGSAWAEYQQSQSICGVALPEGLAFGDRLPEPIYTPAWKAPQGQHDENITFERTVELVGPVAGELRMLSLEVYSRAAAIAEAHGILLADTKFEFGTDRKTGVTTLADEVLTSDSSRYWDAASWTAGDRKESFDKQIVRNWLAAHWDKTGTPPKLPPEIVAQTAARYRELIGRLTGSAAGPSAAFEVIVPVDPAAATVCEGCE
jgi:phosphoribosylaminoimidazole-succinocarboxamide synthase